MPFPTIRTLAAAALIAAVALPATATGAPRGPAQRVTGGYAVPDLGTTACAPVAGASDRLRCRTTGLLSRYSGDLHGESSTDFTSFVDCTAGLMIGHGRETFRGSLKGHGRGVLRWGIHFTSDYDCAASAPSGFVGTGLIRSAAGGLARVGGILWFDGDSYRGVVR